VEEEREIELDNEIKDIKVLETKSVIAKNNIG
jgi:hypothetical protein